jgi:hypothetical protein
VQRLAREMGHFVLGTLEHMYTSYSTGIGYRIGTKRLK